MIITVKRLCLQQPASESSEGEGKGGNKALENEMYALVEGHHTYSCTWYQLRGCGYN